MKLGRMAKTIVRSLWILALLAGLPALAAAQTAGAPALHDGVVVDAAGGTGYVMKSPQGGISAVNLTSGNVVWESAVAAKPLLVTDGTLVAQAPPTPSGALVVVALDAAQGTQRNQVQVPLPAGVRAQVVDGPSASFRAQAFAAGDGTVIVTWTAEDGGALQGMAPPLDAAGPTKGRLVQEGVVEPLRGAVRLNFKTRKSFPISIDKAEALRPRPVARLATKSATGQQDFPSLDGRHILHSERLAQGTLWAPYRWTVTDASGTTVGTLDAPVSLAPFVVSGSQLFYVALPSAHKENGAMIEEPLRLRSLNLQTGVEAWAALVADSEYRGPFPP